MKWFKNKNVVIKIKVSFNDKYYDKGRDDDRNKDDVVDDIISDDDDDFKFSYF